MTVRIQPFSGTAAQWNAFASQQTGFTHFHKYEWRSIMEQVFGHECIYAAAIGERGIDAVLPLVRVRSAIFGHFLVSMPFLNYGGPIGSEPGIRGLVDDAVTLARRDSANLLELRSANPLPIETTPSHRKLTVVLRLRDSAQATFAAFDAKLRSQIRRPQKEGVTIRFGSDQVGSFFRVFAEHMRDLGTPTQPLKFFRAISETFESDVWFACAYLGNLPVAAGCGFVFGGEFELTWASSLRRYNRQAPNMLLYWSLIERAINAGLHRFNFGRCTPGSGTHRFKLQWGGQEERLWWYDFPFAGKTATPSPDDKAYRWAPRVWRHLPLRLATAMGPRIVRYIP